MALLAIRSAALCACLLAAGCAGLPFGPRTPPDADVQVAAPGPDTQRPEARPDPSAAAAAPVRSTGRTADALDTTTPAERAAALTPAAAGGRDLGRTVASLGDPSEPGFWLRTPLVQDARPGQVRLASGGAAVRLELRPSGGAPGSGSQLSLAAFRALGVDLGALPDLLVLAD